ncbi:hypothetical protein [Streptomyces sp. NPDC026589]|uniref:hypothetical protein n=1 Tax=Streptomyces sp. NPDC026589 TaxID=3155609 RepID=UPI0033F7F12C
MVFGQGRHPDAHQIEQHLLVDGRSGREAAGDRARTADGGDRSPQAALLLAPDFTFLRKRP